MNILSFISIAICTSFFIGGIYLLRAERKSVMNVTAFSVFVCLAWWSLCNSFLFATSNPEIAMKWHRLSSIGWIGFVVITTYYFIILTKYTVKNNKLWKKICFFVPAIIMIILNLFMDSTSLAKAIIPSKTGLGWTFLNSVDSMMLWLYVIYFTAYFGIGFCLLYKWQKKVNHKMKKEMAINFIILDAVTIICGAYTDIIVPLTTQSIPAMANIMTAIFGIGYFIIIYRYDLFNINLVISSDAILQSSNNLVFVIDEVNEILKYNKAITTLLDYNETELMGKDFSSLFEEYIDLRKLTLENNIVNIETKMRCKNGNQKDILLSASAATDKNNNFLCIVISCRDVTKQMKIQKELETERKKLEILAKEYQALSYSDLLTNLPNRRSFYEEVVKYEKRYYANGEDFAIIFLDLDNFKHINDVYGHKGGDVFLKATAKKLTRCVNSKEFVARLAGDEFIFIIPYEDGNSLKNKLMMISKEFDKPIKFEGQDYEILISYGTAKYSKTKDIDELIHKADEGMYISKRKKTIVNKEL
ncbi:MAG: diguanylate cyclase [Erysipelotrichaceae bacterium]